MSVILNNGMTLRPKSEIHRLGLALLGAVLIVAGLAVAYLSTFLPPDVNRSVSSFLDWLANLLVLGGGLGILTDLITGRQKDAAVQEALGITFDDKTPQIANAVLTALGESKNYLENIASPELLDDIATNALSLRLKDDQFAREIYTDVRDQAIRAAERWHDVEVNVRLSTAVESRTGGASVFDVLVEWQYTTVPSHQVRRFAAVSDQAEYDELVTEVPATSTWFMTSGPGLDPRTRESFELLYFGVDGKELPIRRTERKTGQTYSVNLGATGASGAKPVRIRHLYRTRVRQTGHFLFIELPQPARNLSLTLDYTDTKISRLRVLDLVSSAARPEIMNLPAQVDAREVSIDLNGWLLPRAGFTFVWSLASEESASTSGPAPGVVRADRADR